MSNEELVAAIQQGRTELMDMLWNQVSAFVYRMARSAISRTPLGHGCTIEDLQQSGYLALASAVETYDPEKSSFLTWLGYYLKTEFALAGGYHGTKRNPLDDAVSLDAPLSSGDAEEGGTLYDVVASQQTDGGSGYADVEERIYTEQLHAALDRAIQELPIEQAAVLRGKYWRGVRSCDLAAAEGVPATLVRYREREGLRHLRQRSHANGLAQFLAENTDYSGRSGLAQFRRSGVSSVEREVLRREELAHRWLKEHK